MVGSGLGCKWSLVQIPVAPTKIGSRIEQIKALWMKVRRAFCFTGSLPGQSRATRRESECRS